MQVGDIVSFLRTTKSNQNNPKHHGIVVDSFVANDPTLIHQNRFKVYFPHFNEYGYSEVAGDYKVISNASR